MPTPRDHINTLQAQIREHQKRVQDLQGIRKHIDREVAIHEVVVQLARDPKLIRALDEIYDRGDAFADAKRNPQAFAESRGIKLPKGARVVAEGGPGAFTISVDTEETGIRFRMIYSSQSGFGSSSQVP